jgi:hypothetical protein
MDSRAKGMLCVLTCAAAVLTGATVAQAVDQFAKNGCTSPQVYSGSITTPLFTGDIEFGSTVNFQGWFEIESVAPTTFDTINVEYSLDPGAGGVRNWIPFGALTDANQGVPANAGGGPDQPYSNNGTNVAPSFQAYSFPLPNEALNQPGTQVRIHFDTGDETYQGFRGVGVDSFAITNTNVSANFEGQGTPAGWGLDPAGGPGGPFWQVLTNPQNVSIKSPEINPDLVTLSAGDNGALPAPPPGSSANTRYAWFGNTDSGTFCGPDYALRGDLAPPDTMITSGPPVSTANNDATFQFTSSEGAAFFECQVDGGGFVPCASPHTYTALPEGAHTFAVRSTDFSGNLDPTPATYSWTIRPATLADLDNPTLGVDVNVQELRGNVLVGLRGQAARASGNGRASQKGVTFVPLSEARQIPVGSFIDTRRGTVRMESAANARGRRQRGTFLQGLFQVRQSKKRSSKGLTDLVLKGSSFRRCNARGSRDASAAGLSRRSIRRLRANARGRYRTSGRNSSATVRGTKWGVTDRCDGTLTKVQRGAVVVRDFRRKRNIVVRAGKSYLAKARRR